jgi:hypothetical protein
LLRILVDTGVLYILAIRQLPILLAVQLKSLSKTGLAAGMLALLILPEQLRTKVIAASVLLVVSGCFAVRELWHARGN